MCFEMTSISSKDGGSGNRTEEDSRAVRPDGGPPPEVTDVPPYAQVLDVCHLPGPKPAASAHLEVVTTECEGSPGS